MTAVASCLSFRASDPVQPATARPAVSHSEVLAKASVRDVAARPMDNVVRLHGIDGHEFRLWFAPQFARYLRDRFASPEQVAAAFGVRQSTAWNWWNGDNRATGDAVARMFVAFPDAAAWFLAAWEGRA